MDERIRFETKEESNARREREFMALTPSQRLQWFFDSFRHRRPADAPMKEHEANFIIRKRADGLR